MQPKPSVETCSPVFPSTRLCMFHSFPSPNPQNRGSFIRFAQSTAGEVNQLDARLRMNLYLVFMNEAGRTWRSCRLPGGRGRAELYPRGGKARDVAIVAQPHRSSS